MQTRTWQVTADVIFPNHFPLDVDDQGNPQLPDQLRPQPRIPGGRGEMGEAKVFIREGDKTSIPAIRDDLSFSLGQLVIRLDSNAADATEAVDKAMPLLDRLLESMSFQMQYPLHLQAVTAIDLTGSPDVGEERAFGQWSSFARPTFQPTSIPIQSLQGRILADPCLELDPNDKRGNRALDWYLKALVAPFEADHFIFLWIACEILAADSDLQVTEPYRAKCDHTIAKCPECGEITAKKVQGASMRRWLMEGFGVPEDVAKHAWKARQMLHGSDAFNSKIIDKLPETTQWLRAVVVAEVKRRLGLPADQPPSAAPTGASISPHVGLSGTAQVTDLDLNPLG